QRGSLDQFHVETDDNMGEVWKIRIWHDNTGLDPSWYVQHVVVWDPQTDHMFFFLLDDWLSVDNETNSTVEKEVLASCKELTLFKRVFTSQLIFGMVDRHLWLSLLERPPHSCFTRGQRVTCGALMLHLYLALGALWYGAVGTVGHSGPISAHLLANVETVAVGMTVAVLVFPLQCFLSRQATSSLGAACHLSSARFAAWSVSGCDGTLWKLLLQDSSTHVAGISSFCLSHFCSAAGTSQGESSMWSSLFTSQGFGRL
uniref:PLAT domain-containing protein n=1 Tax=Maylandia zebra TaxID=106582 RepID=A0A3P9B2C1_9CICH